MYQYLLTFHHYWAMLTLTFLAIFTVVLLIYYAQTRELTAQVKKISLFTLITVHIQLLLGLIILLISVFQNPVFRNMEVLMKVAYFRQRYIEHPTAMIIVAIVVTLVHVKTKKNPKPAFWLVLSMALALALTIGMIPNSFWQSFAS